MSQLIASTTPIEPSPPIRLPYPGYRVARATTREELLAVARRRYQVFVEKMGALPANRPCLEIDAFDLCAEQFYVSVDGVVVGCMRVVRDEGGGFPMEADGVLIPTDFRRHTSAECSRLNAARVMDRDVLLDLITHAVAWGKANGLTHLLGVSNQWALGALRRQGWPTVVFGDPVEHAGAPYYPNYTYIADCVPNRAGQPRRASRNSK